MNRSTRREAKRAAKANGCTCNVSVHPCTPDDPNWYQGATAGAWLQHELGCPLGDLVLDLARYGIVADLISTRGRCGR